MTKHWRTLFESYPCPTCGAEPGEPCITAMRNKSQVPHAARGQTGGRCAKCGALLARDHDEPRALCDYCETLRALAAEQARSTWSHRST